VSAWERLGIYLRLLGLLPHMVAEARAGVPYEDSVFAWRVDELHRRLGYGR